MPDLEVQLLGGFRLRHFGQDVKGIQSERFILLLSHLLIHAHHPFSRKQIAYLFWPETTEEQARTNLRNLFHHLKKAFPELDSFLEMEGQTINWRPNADIHVDVRQFRAALNAAKNAKDEAGRIRQLQEAIELYGGELLPGLYEDWILAEREEFHQAYINALIQLAKLLEDARQYEEAAEIANRLIHSDPLNEAAYGHAMRLHALNDDRAGALQAYHACVTTLKRELNLEPSPEIKTLYEQLVSGAETPLVRGLQEKTAEEIRLVGRKPEWGRLKEAWNFIQKNQARMILLRGESGIGKTRLAEELLTWVRRQGFPAAVARAYPAEGELAYGAVTLWLRSLPAQHLQEIWKTEVSRLLPELLEKNIPAPGALAEAWQQQRFHEGLARAALGSQPLLLILDDIQWADRKTLEWLRFLFRFDLQARFLLLATARNEDMTTEGALHDLIDALRQSAQYEEIPLQRFSESETSLLAQQILQTKPTSQIIETLHRQTEGLPLFIVELTRAGLPTGGNAPASLPDRLQAALAERLSTLTPLARATAEMSSAIGRDFSAPLLAHVADLNESDLLAVLDELWARHILREGERGNYDFSHDKLREYIYLALTPARRQTIHRRVAKALAELEPDDFWGRAQHLEKSGLTREAAEVYALAAKREAEQASYPVARNGYAQALELMGKQSIQQRAEILVAVARICDITGDQDQASEAVNEALQLTASLPNHPLRVQALASAMSLAAQKAQFEDARTWFEMAQNVTQRMGDVSQTGKLQIQMADVELRAGKANEARQLYEQALDLARQQKDHALEAEALEGVGFILPAVGGSMTLARQYIEESARLRHMMGDRLGEARSLCNLTGLLHASGAYEETLILGEEALAKNRAVNYRRGAAIVQASLGLAAYELGQFERARTILDHVRHEFREIGEMDGYGLNTGGLGLVATAEKKWEEAEALFKEAIAIAEENQTEIFAAFAQQDLATLYYMQGRWADARPYFEKALATNLENNDNLGILYDKTMLGHIYLQAGDNERANQLADEVMEKYLVETFEEGGVIRWLWQFKNLLDALGRNEEAAQVLKKAQEAFQTAAEKIKDANLRRSFLENFAHHRELIGK